MGSMTEQEIIDIIDEFRGKFAASTLKGNSYSEASQYGVEIFANVLKTVISNRIFLKGEEQNGH